MRKGIKGCLKLGESPQWMVFFWLPSNKAPIRVTSNPNTATTFECKADSPGALLEGVQPVVADVLQGTRANLGDIDRNKAPTFGILWACPKRKSKKHKAQNSEPRDF